MQYNGAEIIVKLLERQEIKIIAGIPGGANGHLGMVRQQQELFYRNRVYVSKFDLQPDFKAIANGFGVAGYDLSEGRDPFETLAQLLRRPGPSVINVPIDNIENVFPIVPPGSANRDMIRGG